MLFVFLTITYKPRRCSAVQSQRAGVFCANSALFLFFVHQAPEYKFSRGGDVYARSASQPAKRPSGALDQQRVRGVLADGVQELLGGSDVDEGVKVARVGAMLCRTRHPRLTMATILENAWIAETTIATTAFGADKKRTRQKKRDDEQARGLGQPLLSVTDSSSACLPKMLRTRLRGSSLQVPP